MSDLISRQAAIEVLNKLARDNFTLRDAFSFYLGALQDASYGIKELPSAQPEIIRCKDCKYFEYDHLYVVQNIPVVGHLVCNKWGDGCKTDENGYCFLAERRTDEQSD